MQIDLSIFNPKARPLFGLDISSSSVKMVELAEASKGSYRIERYAIETLPRDAVVDGNITNLESVAEAVKRAWKRMGTSTRFVAMALPAAAVITKKIIVPAGLRERELEVQVESEANQYIPFALDEVNLDFQVVGPAPSSPEEAEVLIAASRKEKVEDRVAVAEAAGLKPLVMDVESYAAQAAFELVESQFPQGGKNQSIALVDIGANVMNVTILRNDQPVYVREQAFGGSQLTQDIVRQYGMSQEEAENAKRTGNLPGYVGRIPRLDSRELRHRLAGAKGESPRADVPTVYHPGEANPLQGQVCPVPRLGQAPNHRLLRHIDHSHRYLSFSPAALQHPFQSNCSFFLLASALMRASA